MPNFFPPSPAYPIGIDSDYTLFAVYNTAETRISADNEPWSDEIEIIPVISTADEIWPENGFATIEGELFYYDAVDKNLNGKINKFRRCARNLGGKSSRYNKSGTWVRGFVVAEHHNQLVDTIERIENFVGINFDTRTETLDYRIRNLRETPVIFDDWSCADIDFTFIILEDNPSSGILARFNIQINGSFNEYRLDFGDGTFTTSDQTGTHRYAYNANVNPVVTVINDKCTIIQSPITRDDPDQPTEVAPSEPFTIIIPELQDIPPFVAPGISLSSPDLVLPPIVLPCPFDLSMLPSITIGTLEIGSINIPSLIGIDPINIPSVITITPVDIPSIISITPIEPIKFDPAPVISPIKFGPAPSIAPIDINIDINIDASDIPSCISLCTEGALIGVDWGSPPTLNMAFVSGLSSQSRRSNFDPELAKELGDDYLALFDGDGQDTIQVEYGTAGIPSEIRILSPEIPDIKVTHNIPQEIKILAPDFPMDLHIIGAETIPKEIKIQHDLPTEIRLVGIELPSVIRVEHDIPEIISVKMIDQIPNTIFLDASQIPHTIQVTGVPETIELKGPESIRLVLDENIEVPLVYRQGPIDVKVELDMQKLLGTDENGENNCVMIVPCPRK